MSNHKRGRITVQRQPTGGEKLAMRGMGVFHAIFGTVFFLIGLTALPYMWLFGLIFAAVGAFFAINGITLALGRNGLAQRTAYDMETDVEEETIVGLFDDPDKQEQKAAETHDHIPSTALDAKRRLEQLESLKSAGLVTEQEYRQKRQEILKEL